MDKHELRFLIPKHLFLRYKIVCAKLNLSIPKQGAQLIRHFVEVHEENEKILNQGK